MKEPLFMKNIDILKHIYKTKNTNKRKLLEHLDSSTVKSIVEVALNILKGTIPLSDVEKSKLRVSKSDIKSLVKKNLSLRDKKSILLKNVRLVSLIIKPLLDIVKNNDT